MLPSSEQSASAPITVAVQVLPGSSARLRLRYQVRNDSADVLFLVNQFWTNILADGHFETMPNLVNVQLLADRVVVGKAVVPVPDDTEVERHYTPCLTRVAPHNYYEETVDLPLPLSPFTWYRGRPMRSSPVVLPLYFELGYVAVSSEKDALVPPVATTHGPAHHLDIEPENQSLIRVGPILPEIAVFSAR
ncbi:hypothetical protein [Hymenobacter negativus]|uniref:Uncharacterized protein n=1 Tax=Hymenobacter negativus TaxID=2795026 RepID=A0ABS3QGK7_9BACT|nr:hypothetical protein [Hymenobacter negativus]MBO2010366.1 hypothetical protein [Hymenobacter negativus]